MADLLPGPEKKPRNYLADALMGVGLPTLAQRANDSTSGIGIVADGIGGVAQLLMQPVQSFQEMLANPYQRGGTDSRFVENAFDVAGGAMTGGLLAPRPRASVGTVPTAAPNVSATAAPVVAPAISGQTSSLTLPATTYHALQPGTVYSPLTGELLYANGGRPGAAAGAAVNALADNQPTGIRAYHGSPYDFDRFDMSKIGTGEGAQAYGHGLYFAESEAVAKSYRDAFKNLHDARSTKAKELIDEFSGDVNAAIAEAERSLRYFSAMKDKRSQRDAQGWRLVLDELKAPRNEPRLYEVRINADPEDFIDWDKPLSQQSEKARAVLEPKLADDYFAPDAPIGQILQRELLQRDAVQPLREAGIPGIRYLDQGSRGAGEGSRNYVVFDDSLVEILRKYGLAGLLGAGGAVNSLLSNYGYDAPGQAPAHPDWTRNLRPGDI